MKTALEHSSYINSSHRNNTYYMDSIHGKKTYAFTSGFTMLIFGYLDN